MNRPSLVVLDVGHGNAAVLIDHGGVVVVDAGKGGVLIDFLKEIGVTTVDLLLISHADADHIRNAPDLLLDKKIDVRRVCYNSDASKQSRIWKAFRKAIKEARRNKGLHAEPQLTTSQTGKLNYGEIHIEILYPMPEMAASAPGGEDEYGDAINTNGMSAVVRLSKKAGPMVILAGDVETGCLDAWKEEGVSAAAKVLVFPHHGGRPGNHDPVAFAADMTKAVSPEVVLFSIHRSQYELPIPEVVEAVRRHSPGVRIACTQLSTHCTITLPGGIPTHLTPHEAHGKPKNACCAGTVVIDLTTNSPIVTPDIAQHTTFIRNRSTLSWQ
jgi:beta-lactamase superfamily II metal-dependent hydrolase